MSSDRGKKTDVAAVASDLPAAHGNKKRTSVRLRTTSFKVSHGKLLPPDVMDEDLQIIDLLAQLDRKLDLLQEQTEAIIRDLDSKRGP
jgi:hypothetical protein